VTTAERPFSGEQWERIQEIFHQASDLPRAGQIEFVALRCAGDPELAARVMALLREDASRDSLLDRGIAAAAYAALGESDDPPGAGALPGTLGPYRISHLVGEGGMGVVFLGVRDDLGSVAAIKLLRDAWLSPARRERFASEQRTLAQLTHPSIARLFDAGTLRDGTPWIAMEYVEGVSLVDYCRTQRCSARERLLLVRAVCEAVQHAHRHLVVHRDLKPSNILVTPDGGVKLLDFGIAKHLDTLDRPSEATRTGLRLMTPAYAAPEQLRGGQVGIHTDVYSLGVVLYQLLTGRLPFDLADRTPVEAADVILAAEPERPSVGARGWLELRVSRGEWADLDVLCLTAMHRDPQRRYRTVDALVRDIDHYLASEPLEARPDSLGYRLGKFARRNWEPLAAVAAVLMVVTGLITFYTVRLTRARDMAVAESARTERIQAFTMRLFEGGEQQLGPADSLRVITLIDRGVQEAQALANEPVTQAELYQTLGGMYQRLGSLDRADTLLRLAYDRRRLLFAGEHPDVARSLVSLGLLRAAQAKLDEAEKLVREGLAMSRRLRPSDHPDIATAITALASVLEDRGTYGDAITALDELAARQRRQDTASAELAATLAQLANNHFYAGNYDVSDSINRRVLAMSRRLHGDSHPLVADDLINLGAIQYEKGNNAEAQRYYRQGVAIIERWFGPEHWRTASALIMLSRPLIRESKLEEATMVLERSLAIQERVFGAGHPRVASVLNELGSVALRRSRLEEAEAHFARTAEIYRAVHGSQHYLLGIALANRASVLLERREHERAEALFREALAVYGKSLPSDHLNFGITRQKLGRVLVRQRRWTEAEAELLTGHQILTRKTGPSASWLRNARADLILVYDSLGTPEKAERFRREARE
jgi:serine/threonine protein kinase/tetratricopeptide (TPR) repeat protein